VAEDLNKESGEKSSRKRIRFVTGRSILHMRHSTATKSVASVEKKKSKLSNHSARGMCSFEQKSNACTRLVQKPSNGRVEDSQTTNEKRSTKTGKEAGPR